MLSWLMVHLKRCFAEDPEDRTFLPIYCRRKNVFKASTKTALNAISSAFKTTEAKRVDTQLNVAQHAP